MLRSLIVGVALATASISAMAGKMPGTDAERALAQSQAAETKAAVDAYMQKNSKGAKQAAQSSSGAFAKYRDKANPSSQKPSTKPMQSRADQMRQRGTVVGGVSNKVMADQMAAMRKAMKLNKEDQLYIFVSASMPKDLIRSYSLAAAYSGGLLVMRGIPGNQTLKQYIHGKFMQTIKPKGHLGSNTEIDPRLFDAFSVQAVPTIVYTDSPMVGFCDNGTSTSCPPLDKDKYASISGAVTLKYALDQFVRHGAAGAARFRRNLAKGYALGKPNNPHKMAGLDKSGYLAKLAKISKRNSGYLNTDKFDFIPNTDKAKTTMKNTPFGPREMPVNTELWLKPVGGVKQVGGAK